jgi:hypothetical protein
MAHVHEAASVMCTTYRGTMRAFSGAKSKLSYVLCYQPTLSGHPRSNGPAHAVAKASTARPRDTEEFCHQSSQPQARVQVPLGLFNDPNEYRTMTRNAKKNPVSPLKGLLAWESKSGFSATP